MPAAALGVAAAATIFGAKKSSDATKSATNAAISEQDKTLQQQAQLSQPYRDLGQSAIPTLQNLLGLTTGANPTATLQATPGYQFAKTEGLNAIRNNSTLTGGIGGNTLEALDKFGTGLADKTYQSSIDNLMRTIGLGQAAASGQAANTGQAGAITSNLISGQGGTTAGIDLGTAASLTKLIGTGLDNWNLKTTLAGLNGTGGAGAGTGVTGDVFSSNPNFTLAPNLNLPVP